MRLEDIERLEKLFARDNMYHVPRTRDDLADALYDAADELIAAAFSAASERARADKAEAELARVLDASGTREWWLRMSKLQAATTHPKEKDHEQ